MTDWWVQTLRVSLFSTSKIALTDQDWTDFTGIADPDRSSVPGGKLYVGPAFGGQLIMQYGANRADVILQPAASGRAGFPVVESWENISGVFSTATTAWLGKVGFPIVRLAFGGVLLCKTEHLRAAYEKISQLLKSVTVEPPVKS